MRFFVALASLLTLAACNACSGGKVQIQSAPPIATDAGFDMPAQACAVLLRASCPVAAGCDKDPNNCKCAVALRNDHDNLGAVDLGCILDAGPEAASLRANCNVSCQ